MESVRGPLPQRARDIGPVAPFGFSWLRAVSLRRPPLMRVGFPWISLDCLVRIETYQWVTRFLAGRIFRALFPGVERHRNGEPAAEGMRKRGIVHGASLTWFLIFCKRLSSDPFPFGQPQSKSSAL